ncbi:hypothetical protein PIB30_103918 [Stylosanthes scabra]|uniref:Uncharacterized protein n=1 Tax=Stylosanthes scabra TaxID=79078 RepID=A0ABU6SYE6_9FABA|nr:hypothetical protein [Stylosanthes scabra]
MASSSSISVFDNYRFKSAFNEELYNSIVKNKKVIAECCIHLEQEGYSSIVSKGLDPMECFITWQLEPKNSGWKNEERKPADQETKFGSKAEQELHAYAWKSTHMRATPTPTYA